MKKLLLMCFLFIGLATVATAQTKTATEKAQGLQKQLKLTDAQTTKIAAIYTESSQKFEKIKAAHHGDNTKMLAAIKPLRTETIKSIKATLTKKQAIQYDKLLASDKAAGGSGWGDGWSAGQ
jgi:Spy/CpxP family protein refolding chaperone